MNNFEWEKPIPIEFDRTEEFPIDVYPQWIGNFIKGVSNTLNTQVDLPANAVISALSTSIMGRYCLYHNDMDWSLGMSTLN